MSPSAQEAKEIGGARRWAHEHGHLVPVSDLDLEGKEPRSEARPGALGLQQQRLGGKSAPGPREATVGRPGLRNQDLGGRRTEDLRPQKEAKTPWKGDLGPTEPGASASGRRRQYSLYKVSASRVLHQFAWGGFLWCCVRSRQIGGDLFAS